MDINLSLVPIELNRPLQVIEPELVYEPEPVYSVTGNYQTDLIPRPASVVAVSDALAGLALSGVVRPRQVDFPYRPFEEARQPRLVNLYA